MQLGLLAGLVALSGACERAPEIDEPKFHEADGIAFSYPGNWSVSEDRSEPGVDEFRFVVIESTGNAIVIIHRAQPQVTLTVEEFATQYLEAMIESTESLVELGSIKPLRASAGESSRVTSLVAGSMRDGIEQNFVVSALGEPVPHRSRTFRIDAETSVAFLVAQAATDDWSTVAPGFDLIAESLTLE